MTPSIRAALWVLALHVECSGWTPRTRIALDDAWAKVAVLGGERA